MPAVTRIGDGYTDGDTQAEGSGDVFCNNIAVARLADATTGHGCWPPAVVDSASSTVFCNNIPVARLGDTHTTHCCPSVGCHNGTFSEGSGDVFAG